MLVRGGRKCRFDRSSLAALASVALVLGLLSGGVLLTPAARATPWSGGEPAPTNLLLYLHNSSSGIMVGAVSYLDVLSTVNDSLAPWSGTGAVTVGSHYDSVSFVLAPQLAGTLVLNGTIGANIYMNESGSAPAGGSITLTVYGVSSAGVRTLLGTGPANSATQLGPGGSTPKLIALTGPTLNAPVTAGDSIEVNVTISGNTAESYGIWWGTVRGTAYVSTVTMPASTYLTVPQVRVLNANGTSVSILNPLGGAATASIKATVMDPLGAYDFESFPVNFSVVTRANGSTVYGPVRMSAVPALASPGALNGSYQVTLNFSALAPGTYNFTVTAIDNTNANLGPVNTLPAYYGREAIGIASVTIGLPPIPIHVTVVDDHGVALRGATVLVRSAGALVAQNRSNGTGVAGFDLSNSTSFSFSAVWQGVPAGTLSATVTLPGQNVLLNASVGYPTFHLQTTYTAALAYALVSVVHPNGSVLPLQVTNASGDFRLTQAPAGNYTVTAIYDDAVVVSARAVAVSGDGPVVIVAGNVYTLTVTATDSGGSGLSQVFVQVINVTTDATIASGITGGSGSLTFLVPAGAYLVKGSWSTTYALTSLSQSEQVNISVSGSGAVAKLSFSKAYPAFTSTNEFFLLVGYGLLALLVVVLAVLLLRRKRGGDAAPVSAPSKGSSDDRRSTVSQGSDTTGKETGGTN